MVGVMGHVKKDQVTSVLEISIKVMLIITGSRILREITVAQPLLPGRGH